MRLHTNITDTPLRVAANAIRRVSLTTDGIGATTEGDPVVHTEPTWDLVEGAALSAGTMIPVTRVAAAAAIQGIPV
jgi:hypothetical protein